MKQQLTNYFSQLTFGGLPGYIYRQYTTVFKTEQNTRILVKISLCFNFRPHLCCANVNLIGFFQKGDYEEIIVDVPNYMEKQYRKLLNDLGLVSEDEIQQLAR